MPNYLQISNWNAVKNKLSNLKKRIGTGNIKVIWKKNIFNFCELLLHVHMNYSP